RDRNVTGVQTCALPILPVVWLAAAYPNDAGIGWRDADVTNRRRSLLVEDGFEGRAGICSFPHAAGCRPNVKDRRVAVDNGEVVEIGRASCRKERKDQWT